MKKVILTIATIATLFSCTTEEMSNTETSDFGFSVDTFEGEYLNYETLINGEVSDTCDTDWVFNTNSTMRIDRVEGCEDGSASSGLSQFSSDTDNLYITMNGFTASYPYSVESNGDLTLTLYTGNFEVTYKLTR